MRRFGPILACFLVAVHCLATTFYPEKFTGSDDDRLSKAVSAATQFAANPIEPQQGNVVDFGSRLWNFTRPLVVIGHDPSYLCLSFKASGMWHQVSYSGPGTWLTLENWKDSSMTDLGVRSWNPLASGIRFHTDGSSSRNRIVHCRAQGFLTGFAFDSEGGSDMSDYKLSQVEADTCSKGLAWSGSNNLGPLLESCTATFCDHGFVFVGGSGFRAYGCGGSHTKSLWEVRGGFSFACRDGESELCGTVYTVGGDGLDGTGQQAVCSIDDMEHRGVTGILAVIKKAGRTTFDVKSTRAGSSEVDLECSPELSGVFEFSGPITTKCKGTWTVNGAVAKG